MMKTTSLLIASGDAYAPSKRITNPLEPWNMNISCRIANADIQCGRITNPPERSSVGLSPGNGIVPRYQVYPSIVVKNKGEIFLYYDTRNKQYSRGAK